ncbi:hypothetical protein BT63DRAFT_438667 [Microthyrium microscopicum]|uniref:SigF-like NTF2-like domain-containing protein n=1 Tax=Microthyrium microscopicum TaxID=703497 RepID=A0A6A6UH63_9PEZI|nr:hypothetical protein BT63DRAFT_438667 [Microthyrium microscopicum]
MEDPETQIPLLIHTLTRTPPHLQSTAIQTYFLPSASFSHPFVRTGSWDLGNGLNSRWAISKVYRWYKILSPTIDVVVVSVAVDYGQTNTLHTFSTTDQSPIGSQVNGVDTRDTKALAKQGTAKTAYANIKQTFRIFPLPFYKADVELVVKLDLVWDRHWRRYYISRQTDLYDLVNTLKFLWVPIWLPVILWQYFVTVICILGAWVGWPVTLLEERWRVGVTGGREILSGKGHGEEKGERDGMVGEAAVVRFVDLKNGDD